MTHGIRFVAVAGDLTPAELARHGLDRIPPGAWLKAADVDAEQPSRCAEWTVDPAEALTFDDGGKAFTFWRQTSRTRPVRPDGRPNRPLTAFTVSMERLP